MKKHIPTLLVVFLALVSSNLYSQVLPDRESKEETEANMKEMEKSEHTDEEYAVRKSERASARSSARSSGRASYSSSSGFSYGDGIFLMNNSGASSSNLSLSKTFEGESKMNEGSFNIEKDVRNISLNLNGRVNSGEIKIKITLSNGDVIKELNIDESADVQFNQTISINEEEKKYFGKWTYSIESVKAEGQYRFMISTR